MGSEEADENRAPKLPLFSFAPTKFQEQFSLMGMITPPHHTASIPFNWEEKPGKPKPRPSKAYSSPKTSISRFKKGFELELPPRLLKAPSNLTKTSSIMEGHHHKSIFHSSRFILCREVSFDNVETSALVVSKRWLLQAEEKAAVPASFKKAGFGLRRGNKEVVTKSGLISFWESMYEAVKQVIPSSRRSTNGKWEH